MFYTRGFSFYARGFLILYTRVFERRGARVEPGTVVDPNSKSSSPVAHIGTRPPASDEFYARHVPRGGAKSVARISEE